MVTLYLFLLGVGAVGAGAYLFLFMSHVPGAKDERLGVLEPLPPQMGEWVEQEARSSDGFVVERRYLNPESTGFSGPKILLQVRYRDAETREIVRVDPEQVIKRKRVRA